MPFGYCALRELLGFFDCHFSNWTTMDPTSDQAAPAVGEARPVVVVRTHEGLTAKIEGLGFEVVNRRLRSGPKNWQRVAELMHSLHQEGRLAVVFAYVPTTTLFLLAEEQYDAVRPMLFTQIERARGILFVYEDNVQGDIQPLPWEIEPTDEETLSDLDIPWSTFDPRTPTRTREQWLRENAEQIGRAKKLLDELTRRGLEIVPFRKRSDVTLRMFQALEEAQAGIFLRLYVPHGRYQSEQFEDFLTMFSRYLRDVEGKEFSVDVQRTARGTTYVFKGRGDASSVDDLREATKRFDHFLVLSETDPDAAKRILEQAGVSGAEAGFVVAKYARGLRRLNMEVRHEFERRRLLLKQTFEADMLDLKDSALLPVPSERQPSSLFAVVGNTAPVTINLPQATIATTARMNIGQIIGGGVQYSTEDKTILELIEGLDDKVEALRLRSELDRLKDVATQPEERRTAVQKLKSFLYTSAKYVGRKIDEVGTTVLVAYLERLLPGGGGGTGT